MTAEEVFYDLNQKYGEEFNWRMLPLTDKSFVEELMKELGQEHPIFEKSVYAVARSDSNDDVLYLLCSDSRGDIYRIYHLTYSNINSEGYPLYEEFVGIQAVKEYIEEQFIKEYL